MKSLVSIATIFSLLHVGVATAEDQPTSAGDAQSQAAQVLKASVTPASTTVIAIVSARIDGKSSPASAQEQASQLLSARTLLPAVSRHAANAPMATRWSDLKPLEANSAAPDAQLQAQRLLCATTTANRVREMTASRP